MEEFARIRRYLGLTQRDVSVGTGVPVGRISAAENGKLRLSNVETKLLKSFLDRQMGKLLNAEEAK
jgi:transcriptional regulator with XRE-family HTH domain